jgi:hypothetical protein
VIHAHDQLLIFRDACISPPSVLRLHLQAHVTLTPQASCCYSLSSSSEQPRMPLGEPVFLARPCLVIRRPHCRCYFRCPHSCSMLSINIAKEEKRHIDIQTALNQRACKKDSRRRGRGSTPNNGTPKRGARPWSSATGIGPLTAEIQGRRALLGSLTHGSRVPAAYKELSSILSKDFKGLY